MLARITGILESTGEGQALVVVPGAAPGIEMAYEVLLPAFFAEQLQGRTGGLVTLHTIQSLESPDQGATFTPRLLGFASPDDRRFFELLTTVKGVGTKKALRALAAPPHAVARAITLRDAAALSKLPGIGKRMAETIIAELHGKVEPYLAHVGDSAGMVEGKPARPASGESFHRAVAALVRLGENAGEAERLVRRAIDAQPALETADEMVSAALAAR